MELKSLILSMKIKLCKEISRAMRRSIMSTIKVSNIKSREVKILRENFKTPGRLFSKLKVKYLE